MSRRVKYMVLPAALALLIPLGALARPKNERNVTIPDTVQVGSTQLKAGTYRVEWQGNDQSLHVSFLENGKTVATAVGKMVEKNQRASDDALVMNTANNKKILEEIEFGGKKDALVFPSNQATMK